MYNNIKNNFINNLLLLLTSLFFCVNVFANDNDIVNLNQNKIYVKPNTVVSGFENNNVNKKHENKIFISNNDVVICINENTISNIDFSNYSFYDLKTNIDSKQINNISTVKKDIVIIAPIKKLKPIAHFYFNSSKLNNSFFLDIYYCLYNIERQRQLPSNKYLITANLFNYHNDELENYKFSFPTYLSTYGFNRYLICNYIRPPTYVQKKCLFS
jgi:hypothetical protein